MRKSRIGRNPSSPENEDDDYKSALQEVDKWLDLDPLFEELEPKIGQKYRYDQSMGSGPEIVTVERFEGECGVIFKESMPLKVFNKDLLGKKVFTLI